MTVAWLGAALTCVVTLGVLGAPGALEDKDWTPLLKNKGLVDLQMKCLQGSGPCDRLGGHLKRDCIMRARAVVVVCALAVTVVLAQDFSAFLQDPVFVRRQLACVAGTGQCDGIGRFLRRAATEVLSRNCANCSPEQQENANRLLNFIRTNYPTEYGQIYNRYRG